MEPLRLDDEIFQVLYHLDQEHAIRCQRSRNTRMAYPTRLRALSHSPLGFTVDHRLVISQQHQLHEINQFLATAYARDLPIHMLRLLHPERNAQIFSWLRRMLILESSDHPLMGVLDISPHLLEDLFPWLKELSLDTHPDVLTFFLSLISENDCLSPEAHTLRIGRLLPRIHKQLHRKREQILAFFKVVRLPPCCVGIVMSYYPVLLTKEESHKVLNRGCVIL